MGNSVQDPERSFSTSIHLIYNIYISTNTSKEARQKIKVKQPISVISVQQ